MTSELKGPKRPAVNKDSATDWISSQKSRISKLVAKGTETTSLEESLAYAVEVDQLLKELADFQTYIGGLRRNLNQHCQALRKASPKKGKLANGTEITRNDKPYILIDERFYEIMETPVDKKTEV